MPHPLRRDKGEIPSRRESTANARGGGQLTGTRIGTRPRRRPAQLRVSWGGELLFQMSRYTNHSPFFCRL